MNDGEHPELVQKAGELFSGKEVGQKGSNRMNIRTVKANRLVYYGQAADSPKFWNSHWASEDVQSILWEAQSGNLGYFRDIFATHLPKNGRILEAGCGTGGLVIALRVHGYDCVGVEFSESVVNVAKAIFPDLPVRVGSIFDLDFPDDYFAGYISLGVVEHYREGPERALKEAYRVIEPNGVLLISVPYFSPLRQKRHRQGKYNISGARSGQFYQYAFTKAEFADFVRRAGFQISRVCYYDAIKGIKDEVPCFKWLYEREIGFEGSAIHHRIARALYRRLYHRMLHWFNSNPIILRYSAHMMIIIGKKNNKNA